jgi:hypothetical protein
MPSGGRSRATVSPGDRKTVERVRHAQLCPRESSRMAHGIALTGRVDFILHTLA